MAESVDLELTGGVATITFNRPERLNALSTEMAVTFESCVAKALSLAETRVVLLQGAGRSFLAGGDLSEFHTAEAPADVVEAVIDPMHRALGALAASDAITIAAAQGAVAGAGLSIFIGADLGIAAEGATFSMAYSRIAAVPDCGGTWALPRVVGLRRAMALTLLSPTITAGEALEIGLASSVVPDEDLAGEAMALAKKLAAGPAISQARTKALLRGSLQSDYAGQLDAEKAGFLRAAADPDFAEGLTAFFEKRTPDYGRG